MLIETLSVDRFRNLEPITVSCSPQLNVFTGPNAAGKTSLLESLYILGRGRSFRTTDLRKAIRTGAKQFEVVARVLADGERRIPVGIRQTEKQLLARIEGRPVRRLSDLAALFPVQWLGGNLHRLIEDGPGYRRQYLDWGLFHVKQGYGPVWQRYQRLLKQRNAVLRARRPAPEIRAWDAELINAGEALHRFRVDYVAGLREVMRAVARHLEGIEVEVQLCYRSGWRSGASYAEALEAGLALDRDQGYTRPGPHRADLALSVDEGEPKYQLSRGQQKLLVIALRVSQARLLRESTGKRSLFLVDDLGSELDTENQRQTMALLAALQAQVFVTAIALPDIDAWEMAEVRRFHVKHGTVSEMV
ncbi:MAG: DNA replication/repair protein RecF [Gammaproteobacteria bacterium]|jgi:DNA replication and repair protein RecF